MTQEEYELRQLTKKIFKLHENFSTEAKPRASLEALVLGRDKSKNKLYTSLRAIFNFEESSYGRTIVSNSRGVLEIYLDGNPLEFIEGLPIQVTGIVGEHKVEIILKDDTELYSGLFSGATDLLSFTIPSSVKTIKAGFTGGNLKLKSLIIPDTVEVMELGAFSGTGLETLVVGKGITNVLGLSSITSLKDLTINANITELNSGCITSYYLEKLTINSSITSLGSNVLAGKSNLKEVNLPNTLETIGDYAFVYCSNLKNINIPNNVTSIGELAFSNCSKLNHIIIPDNVTTIGNRAFLYCYDLTEIVIPDSVTNLGSLVFNTCTKLQSVIIGSGVTYIDDLTFYNCLNLTDITIASDTIGFGYSAFYDCNNLSSINFSGNITSILDSAFGYCNNLSEIDLGNELTSIGSNAFIGCYSLETITIPSSVETMGTYVFTGCYFTLDKFVNNSILDEVAADYWDATIVDSDADGYVVKDGVLIKYRGTASDIVIPDSVVTIGESAFYGNKHILSLIISESVETINLYAFKNCINLRAVTIGSNVTTINGNIFEGCYLLESEFVNNSSLTPPSSGSTLSYWGGVVIVSDTNGFIVAKTYFELPNTLINYLGSEKDIIIPNNVEYINIDFSTSGLNDKIESVTIPSTVRGIDKMRSYMIPYLIFDGFSGTIYENAFNRSAYNIQVIVKDLSAWCNIKFNYDPQISDVLSNPLYYSRMIYSDKNTEIKNLVIPNDVTEIKQCAFMYSYIETLEIPESVTSIGTYAFKLNSYLKTITSHLTTAPTIYGSTFESVSIYGTLHISTGSTGYDIWMGTGNYYLGKYNWTKVEDVE